MIEVTEEVWKDIFYTLQINGENLTVSGSNINGTHSLFLSDVKVGHHDIAKKTYHFDEEIFRKYISEK